LSITNESARYIYLSPHYDDAAFSLGGWIGSRPGGLLVNIFTRSEYTASKVISGVDAVSELRAREDKVFAERLQLEARAMGLKEPSLLGRKSRDVSGVEQDAGHLRQALTALLDERVVEQTVIFCPAGIGGHVNHLATRLVAWEWATARGAERQLRFYEDLPYASSWRYRRRGLADLRAATAGWQLRVAGGSQQGRTGSPLPFATPPEMDEPPILTHRDLADRTSRSGLGADREVVIGLCRRGATQMWRSRYRRRGLHDNGKSV
jgi:LmbE family N-acetylglucosaminyl deacetylase